MYSMTFFFILDTMLSVSFLLHLDVVGPNTISNRALGVSIMFCSVSVYTHSCSINGSTQSFGACFSPAVLMKTALTPTAHVTLLTIII